MVELLLSRGHRVRATDLAERPHAFFPDEASYLPADLTLEYTLEEVCRGVEYIFHPAPIFDFSTPRELMEEVNVGERTTCASQPGAPASDAWSSGAP